LLNVARYPNVSVAERSNSTVAWQRAIAELLFVLLVNRALDPSAHLDVEKR